MIHNALRRRAAMPVWNQTNGPCYDQIVTSSIQCLSRMHLLQAQLHRWLVKCPDHLCQPSVSAIHALGCSAPVLGCAAPTTQNLQQQPAILHMPSTAQLCCHPPTHPLPPAPTGMPPSPHPFPAGRSNIRPPDPFFTRVSALMSAHVSEGRCSPQALARCLHGCAAAGHRPPGATLELWLQRCWALLGSMDDYSLLLLAQVRASGADPLG